MLSLSATREAWFYEAGILSFSLNFNSRRVMSGAFDVGLGSAFILLAIYVGGMVVKSWSFDIHATTDYLKVGLRVNSNGPQMKPQLEFS